MDNSLLKNRIKIIQSKIIMNGSPTKIVRIDLLKESNRFKTSPNKAKTNKTNNIHQFSFSQDQPNVSSFNTSPSKQKQKIPQKKLFNTSPRIQKDSSKSGNKSSSKSKIDRIRQKYRNMNPHYEKIDQKETFFKNSIEKLRKSFFKTNGNGKQDTKSILRQIGRYAQQKSRSKSGSKQDEKPNIKQAKPTNVQYYGFDARQSPQKIKDVREKLQKGMYLHFEKAYQIQLKGNNSKMKAINYRNEAIKYHEPGQVIPSSCKQTVKDRKASNVSQRIGQKQMDLVCDIFSYCQKYEEHETINTKDVQRLKDQLIRVYQIRQIQHSSQKESYPQIKFYQLVDQFSCNLKVVFYRKRDVTVYDALYYLKDTNHLSLVCEDFSKIKSILDLQ